MALEQTNAFRFRDVVFTFFQNALKEARFLVIIFFRLCTYNEMHILFFYNSSFKFWRGIFYFLRLCNNNSFTLLPVNRILGLWLVSKIQGKILLSVEVGWPKVDNKKKIRPKSWLSEVLQVYSNSGFYSPQGYAK